MTFSLISSKKKKYKKLIFELFIQVNLLINFALMNDANKFLDNLLDLRVISKIFINFLEYLFEKIEIS